MRLLYRIGADAVFIAHLFLVLLAIFGWAFPSLWLLYMGILAATLVSDLLFGYCILSRWEFALRKRLDPKTDYDYAWTTFYTYKLTRHRISNTFYKRAAVVAITLAIAINLYFKFWY